MDLEGLETMVKAIPAFIFAVGIIAVFVVGAFKGPLAKIIDQMMVDGVGTVLLSLAVRPVLGVAVALAVVVGLIVFLAVAWPLLVWVWTAFAWPAIQAFFSKPY